MTNTQKKHNIQLELASYPEYTETDLPEWIDGCITQEIRDAITTASVKLKELESYINHKLKQYDKESPESEVLSDVKNTLKSI